MFQTPMTQILGIEHPIQCGTMMALTTSEFIVPVAEAGCLCCLPSAYYTTKTELHDEIKIIRDKTDRPFGVNLNLFPHLGTGAGPEEKLEWIIEAGVTIIETSGGNPTPYRERISQAGIKHIHKCARIRDAIKAEKAGVDIISVVGTECGGHPSDEEIGFIVLIPAVLDVIKTPCIAGGGICDGRSMMAAFALGACGVNIGTRFMNTREFPIHDNFKNRISDSNANDTLLVLKSLKSPVRVLHTSWTEKIIEMEEKGAGLEELVPFVSGAVSREGWQTGDVDKGMYAIGQVIGRIHDIPTVKELVDAILTEANEVKVKLGKLK